MKKGKTVIMATAGLDFIALAKKYPLSITAEAKNNVAEIRISGMIHEWQNSAEAFKRTIDALLDDGINDVNLYINCPGGSVFEANEIANEIERFPGSIKGFGGALVASAASYIALICESFEMAENGQYMYHKPMGGFFGNEDIVESNLKLLKNLTAQYRSKYAEKTGMTENKIEANWKQGDVWLNAKEALAQNFITGISKKKAPITEEQKAMFTAFGAPKTPRINTKTENKMNTKIFAQSLGLPEDATEEQINAQILANKQAADEAKALQEQNKITAQANAKAKAKTLLDGAVLAKKMTAPQAEAMQGWAETNYEDCEKFVATLPELAKVTATLTPGKISDIKSKKFEEMTDQEKQELAENDIEAFTKAYDTYIAQ